MLNKSEAKYIQSLSQKKFRLQAGCYVIEGPKLVGEALEAENLPIEKIYATRDWISSQPSGMRNLTITEVSETELERISQLKTPHQVLAVLNLPQQDILPTEGSLTLVLDGVQDPGNLGTIIRMADWFGLRQIVCSQDTADAWASKVVQASMGSIFRVSVHYTKLSTWLAAQELPVYGAALQGRPLGSFEPVREGILIIGNESKGIRENLLPLLSERITIERFGQAESLNAAVATAIVLYRLTGAAT